MRRTNVLAAAMLVAVGCAKGQVGGDAPIGPPGDGHGTGSGTDASCTGTCDTDGDGVPDGSDKCPGTPTGQPVNKDGCADSQLTAMLNPNFPPYGLTWTNTGDIGRAGGLTWGYTGIDRGDLFHIYWLVCDDPTTPCGYSLDGPIDKPTESWILSINDTDLPGGKLVFTNSMHITLADGTQEAVKGRLTVSITDGSAAPIPFANVAVLHVTARLATYGAEITGTAFSSHMLIEIQDPTTQAWTPSLDWYDAAATPDDAGMPVFVSFDGAFYDK